MISRIITIDQSTSATKAMLFSEDCELLHRVNIEHQQFYPQIGWVEHDAEEIYKNTIEAIHCLLEQEEVNGKDISYSLAITNQRETVVVWNRHTGKSVYHAVVWQCQRGAAICKELKDKGYSASAAHIAGKPYTSTETFTWLTEHFRTSLSQCKCHHLVSFYIINDNFIINTTSANLKLTFFYFFIFRSS